MGKHEHEKIYGFSTNQKKLEAWRERHSLRDHEIAYWFECSPSYIRKLRKEPGIAPLISWARDVKRCMTEGVPPEYRDVTFNVPEWSDAKSSAG